MSPTNSNTPPNQKVNPTPPTLAEQAVAHLAAVLEWHFDGEKFEGPVEILARDLIRQIERRFDVTIRYSFCYTVKHPTFFMVESITPRAAQCLTDIGDGSTTYDDRPRPGA